MKNPTFFESGRELDVICLGRCAVDLYSQQMGARLEDVSTFSKYLGGSSANIAANAARLGLKSAMLTRVGDDHKKTNVCNNNLPLRIRCELKTIFFAQRRDGLQSDRRLLW